MQQVVLARKRGQRVIGEAVTSGLALEESVMWHDNFTEAAQYVMSPPIKSAKHRAALRQALAGGALQVGVLRHLGTGATIADMDLTAHGHADVHLWKSSCTCSSWTAVDCTGCWYTLLLAFVSGQHSTPVGAPLHHHTVSHAHVLNTALDHFYPAATQLVGTDHCVFNSTQKARGKGDFRRIPNGVNGIEERLHVVWEDMVNTGEAATTSTSRPKM